MRLNEKFLCRMYGVDTPPFFIAQFPPLPPVPKMAPYLNQQQQRSPGIKKNHAFGVACVGD